MALDVSLFFNPYHDARGRFTTRGSHGRHAPGNSPPYRPPYSKSDHLQAIQSLLMDATKIRGTLNPGEKIAMRDYTGTFQGSHAINQALLGKSKTEWDTGKPYTSLHQEQTTVKSIHDLEAVFDRTPLNKRPMQLIRGIGTVGKEWGTVGSLEGMVLSSDALSSTTMDVGYAAYAAKTTAGMAGKKPGQSVLMVMHVPEKTVRALPISDVMHAHKDVRPRPGHEVLLPPGTKVLVHNDEPNTDPGLTEGGKIFDRIVRVEVLPEDPDYRQNLSIRDGRLSGVFSDVSQLGNPYHDARGRFTTGPGGGAAPAVNSHIRKVPADELDRRIAEIRARKKAYAEGPIGKLRDAHAKVPFDRREMEAMSFYEGSFERSKVLNDIFRKGDYGELPKELIGVSRETIFTHAAALKVALDRSPALATPATLYRTVRNVPEAWTKGSVEGLTLKDEGFMSTTSKKSAADYYLNYVERQGRKDVAVKTPPAQLILNAPAGTKALPIDFHLPEAATEEILLPPGTAFKVTKDVVNDRGLREIYGSIVPVQEVAELANPHHDARGRFTTGPGGGGFGESGGLKASFELGTVKDFKILSGGLSGASVVRATTQDDRDVVIKIQNRRDTIDAEYLGGKVNEAIGGSPAPVARINDTTVVYGYVDGDTGYQWANGRDVNTKSASREAARLPGGREIGLMDKITTNVDRHPGNYVLKDGRVYPIDNGSMLFDAPGQGIAKFDPEATGTFAEEATGARSKAAPLYKPAELQAIRPKLDALAPEFENLNRQNWHRNMMAKMDLVISEAGA